MPTLEEMRNKVRKKPESITINPGSNVPDSSPSNSERFPAKFFYERVRADRSIVREAAAYYEAAWNDAKPHIVTHGPLETRVAETPGLAFFYRNILTDAQQIRKWLEDLLDIETAKKHTWLMTSPDAKAKYGELKTTEAGKFAKSDPVVIEISDQMRLIAYWEQMLDNVALGFQARSLDLNKIVTIRANGLQEVIVQPGVLPNH